MWTNKKYLFGTNKLIFGTQKANIENYPVSKLAGLNGLNLFIN